MSSKKLKLCPDCYELLNLAKKGISLKDHVCPSESRSIKHHVLKSIEFPKIDRESSHPKEHKRLVLKQLLKDEESNKKSSKVDKKVDKKEKKQEPETDKRGRKLSGYMVFCKEMRSQIKKDYPDAGMTDMSKLLGKAWKELSDHEKSKY